MSTLIQRNFSGGELSPSLFSRVDQNKYATGARTLRNGYIRKSGGWENRPGDFFVYSLLGNYSRFIPWESNVDAETYVLNITNGRIEFIQNGVLVRISAPLAWSNATNYVVGDLVVSGGINYYCIKAHINHVPPNLTYWFALIDDVYSIPFPISDPARISIVQYVQEANKMTFSMQESLPLELVRNGHTNWVMTPWPYNASNKYGLPIIAAPTGLAASGGGSGGAAYVVTAIGQNGEESLPSNLAETVTAPSSGTPVHITWNAVAGAKGYNVYAYAYGTPLFIFFVTANVFDDIGYVRSPDAERPPEVRPELDQSVSGSFPKVIGTYQQRTLLANFGFNTQAIYAGKIGLPQNFTKKFPILDDDSILFQIKGKKISGVRHLLDLGALIAFADSGEWIIKGDPSGALTPGSTSPEQYSYNGASALSPIVIGSDAIYVQAQGSIVRALGFDSLSGGRDGFRDADLTAFADHLVENKTIVAWAYQKTPNSIVWMVRNDGKLLSLTYIKEQQILAWCRHDTDGLYKDVVSVPENGEHAVYVRVERIINGVTKNYIERFHSRYNVDIIDTVILDCSLTYDGRNTTAVTMTASGGTLWTEAETQTLTSSLAAFSAGDVGNEIHLTGPTGEIIRYSIEAFTSTTVVTARPDKTVPVNMRGVALTSWARAVDSLSGLSHLEGKKVGVFADRYVVNSPNNEVQYGPSPVVTAGVINLNKCYSVIHVGLPYISDLETLDIDTAQGETILDKKKCISKVNMHVKDTRGVFVGPEAPSDDSVDPLENLTEAKLRENENYGDPVSLSNGVIEVVIRSEWNSNGRVFVRQVDPIPITVLSVAPSGLFPFRVGG